MSVTKVLCRASSLGEQTGETFEAKRTISFILRGNRSCSKHRCCNFMNKTFTSPLERRSFSGQSLSVSLLDDSNSLLYLKYS